MEVLILSGFLGSGKTTLLSQHLRQADTAATGVIVNEVGQIDIDGALVQANASVSSRLLTNGCICCAMGSDLLETIEQLQHDRLDQHQAPFERLIIECSGLSLPGPIIRSLQNLRVPRLRIRVLTVFDVVNGCDQLDQHDEVAGQLAAAHRVVLSYLDRISPRDANAARQMCQHVNPLMQLIDEADPEQRARLAFASGLGHDDNQALDALLAATPAARPFRFAHRDVRPLLLRLRSDLDWSQISSWLDDLASYCGRRMLRLKGFVQPADSPYPILVQSVGTVFSQPQPLHPASPYTLLGLVLIGKNLSHAEIDALEPGMLRQAA